MTSSRVSGYASAALPRSSGWFAALFAIVFSLSGMAAHAAEDASLSEDDQACQECHAKPNQKKKLPNGEFLNLTISTEKFLASMHNETSCEDCHEDIDSDTHGKEKKDVASRRAYALSMQDSCFECHKENFKSYQDSLHAALVKEGPKEGRKDAPLCSDCHDSHTVHSVKIIDPIDKTPCAQCHEPIFKAYAKDVHGLERVAKGKDAPICSNCHASHGIKAASLGNSVKDACITCHKEAEAQHKDWLPNAGRHFEAISCPVCHAPKAERRVNLRLFDLGAKRQVSEKTGVPQFEMRALAADANGDGLDESELRKLLKQFKNDGGEGAIALRGRLEVRSGVEAHQMSVKEDALKDCKVCHQAGSEPFQSVSLTIAGADGRPLRHAVQKEVLNSLLAMDTVRGFYALGSTRIKLFDYVLVLLVVGSVGGVFAHWLVRRLMKPYRERRKAAQGGTNTH
jgi:hypothetical protein